MCVTDDNRRRLESLQVVLGTKPSAAPLFVACVCVCVCACVCAWMYITEDTTLMTPCVDIATCMCVCVCATSPDVDMRSLPLVGSFKLYVSFAKYRLFYRVLLRKRRIILRYHSIVVNLLMVPRHRSES